MRRARELHPDQFGGWPVAERSRAERQMQELNAAWTVLSDEEARRAYDASLNQQGVSGGTSPIVSGRRETWTPFDPAAPPPPRPDLGPVVANEREMQIRGPAKLLRPGRLVVIATLIVGLIVVASVAGGNGEAPRSGVSIVQPTGVPIACISLAPVTEEVPCGTHDAIVWSVVDADTSCPADLEPIYRQGLGGLYCVTRVD